MSSHDAINSNYLFFNDFVQPRLTRRALVLAGGCEFTAEELLAQAADFFVNDFRYLSNALAVRYGQLCLLRAARDERRRRRGQSLEQILEAAEGQDMDARRSRREADWGAAEGQNLDEIMDLASWSALLDRAVGQWGCPHLKEFWSATKAGMDRAEAAATAGLTQVQVTRMLDFMAVKLTGRPRSKGKPGKGDDQQPGLFGFDPEWQGV